MPHPRATRWTRLGLAVLCTTLAASGVIERQRIHEQNQPCWAVRQFIDFNRTTQEILRAKTYWPPAGSYDEPRVPTAADYQAWIDGLHQRADRVTTAQYALHAHRASDLATESRIVWARVGAEGQAQKPGEHLWTVPSMKDLDRVEREFLQEMVTLNRSCPP